MAEITATLSLEINKFRRALTQAGGFAKSFARRAGGVGARLGTALFSGAIAAAKNLARVAAAALAGITAAGIAAGAALTGGLKQAFDLGGRLSDVAARIGDSAGNAQILETMFAQAGVAAEKMAPSIQKMQRAIIEARDRGGTLAEPFEELGLDINKLATMGGREAFEEIARAIGQLESSSERSARAMQIFGRSGGELLTLFSDPEAMGKAASMVGTQAKILDEHAAAFDRASDIWGGLSSKVTGFFVGVGESMITTFLPALEALNKVDLAPIGQRLGQALTAAMEPAKELLMIIRNLSNGERLALVGDILEFAFKKAVNTLFNGLRGAFAAVQALVTAPDFWKGLGNALKNVGLKLGQGIMEVFAMAFEHLSKLGGQFNPLAGKMEEAAKRAREDAGALGSMADDAMTESGRDFFSSDTAQRIIEAFKDSFANGEDLFSADAEELKRRIAEFREIAEAREEADSKTDPEGEKKPSVVASPRNLGPNTGGFFDEINALLGRTAEEALAMESRKQTGLLETIEKNTRPVKNPPTPLPSGRPVFA